MKKRNLLILLLIFIFVNRTTYYIAQPDFCTDHISQMAMAKNFMEGNGLSFKYLSHDENLSFVYKTHIQWPPLYPFVLAVVSFITGNLLLSSFIIALLSIILMIYSWIKIFKQLNNYFEENAAIIFLSLTIISTGIFNNLNTIYYAIH